MIIDLARGLPMQAEVARRGGLGLKRCGNELVGPCPRCGGRDRFAISISKRVFVCRGCAAAGDIIALVQFLDGCDFRTAVRTLAGFEMGGLNLQDAKSDHRPLDLVNQPAIDEQNTERALKLWADAVPICGTVAEKYLHHRGLHDLPDDGVLRFHPASAYGKARVPCLIALYRNIITNAPHAISRTALDAAGNRVGRMSLGPVGGAAIKIDPDEAVEHGLIISEGLETGLAGRMLGFKPCWSLGSAGAVRNFPVLAGTTSLTILVDHDEADRRGRQAGQEAALGCSERWREAGVEVTRIVPRAIGADMADLIEQGGRRHAG